MAKRYHVDLSAREQEKLQTIINKRKATSQAVKRSKILMAADRNGTKNWKDEQIKHQYEVSVRTIERLRKR